MFGPMKILTEEDCLTNLQREEARTVDSVKQNLSIDIQKENAANCIIWEGLLEMVQRGETVTLDLNEQLRWWPNTLTT
jgi:hypothetical protein